MQCLCVLLKYNDMSHNSLMLAYANLSASYDMTDIALKHSQTWLDALFEVNNKRSEKRFLICLKGSEVYLFCFSNHAQLSWLSYALFF